MNPRSSLLERYSCWYRKKSNKGPLPLKPWWKINWMRLKINLCFFRCRKSHHCFWLDRDTRQHATILWFCMLLIFYRFLSLNVVLYIFVFVYYGFYITLFFIICISSKWVKKMRTQKRFGVILKFSQFKQLVLKNHWCTEDLSL